MKRISIILASAFFMCGIALSSCLKDEGNYNYKDLGNFYVDTVGKQVSFTIKQFETLSLPSNLVYDGDESKLVYRWELYKTSENIYIGPSTYNTGFSHGYTRLDFPDRTIANTKDLAERISNAAGSYYLAFTATNPETGFAALMRYNVTIQGTIGTGLAVLYKGSGGIEIDVVATPVLDGNLTTHTYVRNAYSTANPGRPFAGEPRKLIPVVSATLSYLYLTSTEDAVRLNSFDMTVAHEFKDMFAGTAPTKKDVVGITVQTSINATTFVTNDNYNNFLVNDGVMYKSLDASLLMTPMGMPGSSYSAAPFTSLTYGVNCMGYDAANRRFIFSSMWSAEVSPATNTSPVIPFANIGKDMVHWGTGFYESQGYANYCIFKNPIDDGSRYLYIFTASVAAPASYPIIGVIDLSYCPEITDAKYFAFGERGPVVFYASGTKIYQLDYNISMLTATGANTVWNFAADEEITAMKLFKRSGINRSLNYKDKYLMVATYNSTTGAGKLYLLTADISSGLLESAPAAVYDFPGKISDFDFIDR